MGAAATKAVGNVYYEARKKAAMYNDRLSSREGAAEALGISPSTLADYELGLTKFVPVENVMDEKERKLAVESKEKRNKEFEELTVSGSATKGEGIRALLNSSLSPMKIENEGFTALVLPVRMKNRA